MKSKKYAIKTIWTDILKTARLFLCYGTQKFKMNFNTKNI